MLHLKVIKRRILSRQKGINMTEQEMKFIEDMEYGEKPIIDPENLLHKNDRTLLWGYTCDRWSWHVYLKDMKIYTVTYEYMKEPIIVNVKTNNDFVPNKRLYPEACDYDFCKALARMGVHLPFTTFQSERPHKQYHGELLREHRE